MLYMFDSLTGRSRHLVYGDVEGGRWMGVLMETEMEMARQSQNL